MKNGVYEICIIGFGYAGQTHLENYKRIQFKFNFSVIEEDISKKEAIIKEGARFFNNLEDAVNEVAFDFFDICLPTFLHYLFIEKIVSKYKKDYIVEKPLAINYLEAEKIVQITREYNRIGFCAHKERFYAPMIEMKELISSSDEALQINFVRKGTLPKRADWFYDTSLGGDVLLDMGIHDIDLMLWFVKSTIKSVKASTQGKTYKNMFPCVESTIEFDNGTIVKILSEWDVSTDREYYSNDITVIGKKLQITFNYSENTYTVNGVKRAISEKRNPDAYIKELTEMVNSYSQKRQPIMEISEAAKALEVIDLLKSKMEK